MGQLNFQSVDISLLIDIGSSPIPIFQTAAMYFNKKLYIDNDNDNDNEYGGELEDDGDDDNNKTKYTGFIFAFF